MILFRKLRLSDAVESQQFYFKLHEIVDWIKEKEPILKVTNQKPLVTLI